MSEKRFLITFPNDDTTTYYLFIWEKSVLDYASKKGIDFTKFEDKEVIRPTIEKIMRQSQEQRRKTAISEAIQAMGWRQRRRIRDYIGISGFG